jgi:Tfp pilus assembly protein PilV
MQSIEHRSLPGQRGGALLEALIAVLVMSLGVLSVTRLQTQLRLGADLARQRSEAVRFAQEEIESLRSFGSANATADTSSYDAIADDSHLADAGTGQAASTRYRIVRTIDAVTIDGAKSATITAAWTDRTGVEQQATLHSVIARVDPAYTGALALVTHGGGRPGGALGRSVRIPVFAKDLGDGKSALKPVSGGRIAFVFSNTTGQLIGLCTGVASTLTTRDLAPKDLDDCDTHVGYLLSGAIRYSSAIPPDVAGKDRPPVATVKLSLTGEGYPAAPTCAAELVKGVSYFANGSMHIESVPINAMPGLLGLSGWRETGDRHLAYFCAVYPKANGRWSGRSTVEPSDWTIGKAPTDRKVCRYTNDADHNGKIDANIEHPDKYAGVDGSLNQQNFLLINGAQSCPTVGVPTEQHQP